MCWSNHCLLVAFTALLFCLHINPSLEQYTNIRPRWKNNEDNDGSHMINVDNKNKNKYNPKSGGMNEYVNDHDGNVSSTTELTLLLLMSHQNELPIPYELVKPAIELAMDYVNKKYTNFRIKVKSRKDANTCEENSVGAIAAEQFYTDRLDGLIGPICLKALEPVARLAAYWQIPIITAGGIGFEFSNKKVFSSLTRIAFSLDRVADFFSKIIQDYDWHHISLIVDESEPMNVLVKKSFEMIFRNLKNYPVFIDIQEFSKKYTEGVLDDGINYHKILLNSKKASRVFVFLMNGELSRNFLINAYDLNMYHGDYVFFGVELVQTSGENNDFSWYKVGDRNNKKAKIIYESYFSMSVRVPTSAEYNLFAVKVMERAKEESSNQLELMTNPLIAAFYDAVVLYAWAYNRSLGYNETTPFNVKFRKLVWNNAFPDGRYCESKQCRSPQAIPISGLTGDLIINQNGDRELDYTLNDFNPETGIMQPVLTYFGIRRQVEKIEGVTVHWPSNGNSPLDEPYCGFMDEAEYCQDQEIMPAWLIVLISLLVTIIAFAIIGILVLQRIRSEQDLASSWWDIDYKEIQFPNIKGGMRSSLSQLTTSDDGGEKGATSGHNTSMRGQTQMSMATSLVSAGGRFDSVLVGKYRGILVAYKPLDIRRLNINRKLLFEFRQMRDLTHENLVRFIGICLEDQNTAIVTELMSRGSLRDVLDNEKFQIDWTFRYSMINDIVEGMLYLHNSTIQYHGHLKSTNCVVDGRFMVKITDYGMRSLHKQVTKEQELNPRILFWTAPEHLRSDDPVNHGSKPGDVYSFAIILKEIITRTNPYDSDNRGKFLEPSEILDRVSMGIIPPFRPELVSPDCPNSLKKVVQACWAEDPSHRPEFSKIKPAIRKISKGISSTNFLDNLLNRMEQYSQNLEKIVEEKTESIQEEKLKTEELLYQILPKYIANELKSGRHVKPELFECATILFSDIVGFTILSSMSSPMQVVQLLNELYSKFDEVINLYDAYKIETIGDAYMIASGVPTRNGNEHAKEVALLATELLKKVSEFKIRHLPQQKLKLRIGIHSGPCATGVVGSKMPKYVVFGDTVNTASKLESSSEPLKIHVSESCKQILDTFNRFSLTKRGEIDIQDKKMTTYWLNWFENKSFEES